MSDSNPKKSSGASSHITKWFHVGGHLPPGLPRAVMVLFMRVADELDRDVPNSPEKTAGMRKLLEAKDCMVRASIAPEAVSDELADKDDFQARQAGPQS